MKDTYVSAKLVAANQIRIEIFSSLPFERLDPTLFRDEVAMPKMTPLRVNTLNSLAIADFRTEEPLELGHRYFLNVGQYGLVPLDVNEACFFPDFDEQYYYEGDDLGATYTKKRTTFKVWAPLASKVELKYRRHGKNEAWSLIPMIRGPKGVYIAEVDGNLDHYEYVYLVTNSEITREATDPYAKASTANGRTSVVLDFSKLHPDFHQEALPILQSGADSIIYETHIRDFTISQFSDISHKGKFLGMVEKGRKTPKGHPAGLDYLKFLNVTHVQLLPIYDFKTVDETKPDEKYNWGYDPQQYFVPEGSYATDPEDPVCRIKECQQMIASLHEARIRVVMDVVYNHVYESRWSVFERIVPNYYFRRRYDGRDANTSGCGNDLASERPMVRRLIVDACLWWVKTYGIDGFRFDLMGIIDVDTLNEIVKKVKAIKPSFAFYGEGWNMGGDVNIPLGHMGNFRLIPEYGFFNDFYRETAKRYFAQDGYAASDFKYGLVGSCCNFIHGPKFLSARQSINYLECHDNQTYYDWLSARRRDLGEKEKLELVEASNAAVLLSFGVPFIHMGEEVAASKWGEDNTYNKGDDFNKFSYKLLDERFDMAERFARLAAFRRRTQSLHVYDARVIDPGVDVIDVGPAIRLCFVDENLAAPYATIAFYYNASDQEAVYHESIPVKAIQSSRPIEKKEASTTVTIPPRTVIVYAAERKAKNG